MGVLTGDERSAQIEKAKMVPHIVNLHEDPALSKQLIHFFDDGKGSGVWADARHGCARITVRQWRCWGGMRVHSMLLPPAPPFATTYLRRFCV